MAKDKDKPLSPKEEVFCQLYCNLGGETFCHGTKSAKGAKYSETSAHVRASNLLKEVRIKERIAEIQTQLLGELGLTAEYVLLGIVHDQQKARETNDFKASNACSRLLGETLALFKQRSIINATVEDVGVKLTEIELQAIKDLARSYNIKLARKGGPTHE